MTISPLVPGTITLDEMWKSIQSLGMDLDEEQFRSLVKRVDKDGSGEIDSDEFVLFMRCDDARCRVCISIGSAAELVALIVLLLSCPNIARPLMSFAQSNASFTVERTRDAAELQLTMSTTGARLADQDDNLVEMIAFAFVPADTDGVSDEPGRLPAIGASATSSMSDAQATKPDRGHGASPDANGLVGAYSTDKTVTLVICKSGVKSNVGFRSQKSREIAQMVQGGVSRKALRQRVASNKQRLDLKTSCALPCHPVTFVLVNGISTRFVVVAVRFDAVDVDGSGSRKLITRAAPSWLARPVLPFVW